MKKTDVDKLKTLKRALARAEGVLAYTEAKQSKFANRVKRVIEVLKRDIAELESTQ